MTLRHLKIFIAVCETGSVTFAGEKLYIAQPSVSLAISELEEYYGIKLFDRISKRLYITESGKHFLQYAIHIVALFDEMEKGVRNWDSMGILRVGASITIGNYLLPKYVIEFQNTHAEMKINAIIDNSETIEDNVLNNKIDIGLIEGSVHSSYIESKPFMDDELVLICGINHPLGRNEDINIEDLKNVDFIFREKGSASREKLDGIFSTYGIEINPIWQSISTQAIIKAVSSGLGVSVLPYLLVKDSLERKEIKIVKIKNVSFCRKFSVIYHKNKFLTQGAKDFIALCK